MLTRCLLQLLRTSLWNKPADPVGFIAGHIDWDAVGKLALSNTVLPLAFNGVESLPEEARPPKRWLLDTYAFCMRARRTHALVDSCIAETVSVLRKAGIDPVLLKGQAFAVRYPDPTLRQCGDIDLYVGDDAALACEVMRRHGFHECPGENNDPKAKHFGFALRGVRIELHRKAAVLPGARSDRRFMEWSRQQLSTTDRTVLIAGEKVRIPTPIFEVVFVFLHLFYHFASGGVGLRHLCDWVMLLHVHAGAFDLDVLKICLRDFGLLSAWRIFSPVAVEALGLPENEFPFYTARYRSRKDGILQTVVSEGNFGWYAPDRSGRPEGYWSGKFHSLRLCHRQQMARMSVMPGYAAKAYAHRIYIGVLQILNDKHPKKIK